MKKNRHALILELIESRPVSTQEELLSLLCENGFDVTQATVSRDIKELKLMKITDTSGRYCYSAPKENVSSSDNRYKSIMSSSVVSVRSANNMVCVRCHAGMAQATCFAIDEIKSSLIIGTIAGDDTIFIMCENEDDALAVSENIRSISGK